MTFKNLLLLAAFSFFISNAYSQKYAGSYSVNATGFIKNEGQFKDQFGQTNGKVRYLYSDHLFNLQLKDNGFSYEVFEIEPSTASMYEYGSTTSDEAEDRFFNQSGKLRIHRIDITIAGANPSPEIIEGNATGASFNYYLNCVPKPGTLNVPAFEQITYKDIYPGIDLVFSASDGMEDVALKYEWIVRAGGNPKDIRLIYSGAEGMYVDNSGSLQLLTSLGNIEETRPVCFQNDGETIIASGYALKHNELRYNIASYSKSEPLIIDPTIVWGTFYGGSENEDIFESEIALAAKNKLVITGATASTNNIATDGAYQTDYSKFTDIFVAKFKSSGKLEWATYFGDKGKDGPFGVTIDLNDNVIIEGSTSSDSGVATPGVYKDTITGTAGDILLTKFTSKGELIWSTYMGGYDREHARSGVVDRKNNIYICGFTASLEGMATPGAYDTSYNDKGDAYIAKFTPDGMLVWSTYYSGPKEDRAHAMTIDTATGTLYVVGTCESAQKIATTGAYQSNFGGKMDVFLSKWDTAGHLLYGTYFGGGWEDRARGVVVDSSRNIYIIGFTDSETNIGTPGTFQPAWHQGTNGGSGSRSDDGFIAKFNPSGFRIWGTYYGGSSNDQLRGLALDGSNIYVIGDTHSQANIAVGNAYQSALAGSEDAVVARFDTSGQIIWGSYLGGLGHDDGNDITFDSKGFIYLSIESDSSANVTSGTNQTVNKGGYDAVIYKFYPGTDCYDNYEKNEKFSKAERLKAYDVTETNVVGFFGGIIKPTDHDWFFVVVQASAPNYRIILTDLTKNYDIWFYNKNDSLLGISDNSGVINDTITFNNLHSGNYYFEIVHDSTQFDSLHCYRLQVMKSATPYLRSGETGIADIASELKLYPNPANQQITVTLISPQRENARLVIYDVLNRIVQSTSISLIDGYQKTSLPLDGLSPGQYQLAIYGKEKTWTNKFVKQ